MKIWCLEYSDNRITTVGAELFREAVIIGENIMRRKAHMDNPNAPTHPLGYFDPLSVRIVTETEN